MMEVVRYVSQGKTAVICSSQEDIEKVARYLKMKKIGFKLFIQDSKLNKKTDIEECNCLIYDNEVKIHGYLGNFSVTSEINGKKYGQKFDLILDLRRINIKEKLFPPGYFVVDNNRVYEKITELKRWEGVFEKPKYFNYEANLCARNSSINAGCSRCVSVCCTEAISIGEQSRHIEINPYLCQGCGDCSSVCPTGAINLQGFDRTSLLNEIRSVLSEKKWKVVLFDIKRISFDEEMLPNVYRIELHSYGELGLDIILSCFAYGATEILIHKYDDLMWTTIKNISEHIDWANRIMGMLGYNKQIRWIKHINEYVHDKPEVADNYEVATYAGLHEKKESIRLALDFLIKKAPIQGERIDMPNGAPFGTVIINSDKCTLCAACVSLCPTDALQASNTTPEIMIIEEECVQCAVCAIGCPEDAISLVPSLNCDVEDLRTKKVLVSDEMFLCRECAKSFASKKMITGIAKKMAKNPAFKSGLVNLLYLCEDCKIKYYAKTTNEK